jgi:hypothetical protein
MPGRSTADDAASGRAGASGAPCTFLSTGMRESVTVLLQAVRLCSCDTRSKAAAPLAAPPPPLRAAFGRTAVLPNPASLAGDDASAGRYTPQRTRASSEALK